MAKKLTKVREVKTYKDQFLNCRLVGHNWHVLGLYKDQQQLKMKFICQTCFSEKSETVRRDGEMVKRGYDYTEGYAMNGEGRLSRKDARKEFIRRSDIFNGEDALPRPTRIVAKIPRNRPERLAEPSSSV